MYIYIYLFIYIYILLKQQIFLVSWFPEFAAKMLQIWKKKTAPMPFKGFLFSSVKLILNVTGAISLMQSIGMFHLAGPRARAGTSWFLFLLSAILRLQWSGGARGGWLSWNVVPHCPFGSSPAQSAAYSAGCSQSNARHNFTRDPLLERMQVWESRSGNYGPSGPNLRDVWIQFVIQCIQATHPLLPCHGDVRAARLRVLRSPSI